MLVNKNIKINDMKKLPYHGKVPGHIVAQPVFWYTVFVICSFFSPIILQKRFQNYDLTAPCFTYIRYHK